MLKNALFVFNGDPMCFIHVLLNALDMQAKGHTAAIVIEGAATRLLPELAAEGNPLNRLWQKTLAAGLLAGVCKACAQKMGTTQSAVDQSLALLDDMSGHPSMSAWQADGYSVISF
jgi:hypothetical protein